MLIGKLNKRVTLLYDTKVSDGMGGFTTTETEGDTIWAAIWPTSAREIIRSESTNVEITHRIQIRYRGDVKRYKRIKFGQRKFAISSVINPEERNEKLDLLCIEST